jgi:Family of unknown function (DUF5329)
MLAGSFLFLAMAFAEPPANVQAEIEYLLEHVEKSGCEFYRNGTWYDGKRARAHLSDKYQYFAAKGQINTTEEFIARAATASSSGTPYQIKCAGGAPMGSNRWLGEALAAYRQSNESAPVTPP